MHDIPGLDPKFTKRNLADFHIKRMVLCPYHWQSCTLPVKLKWQIVRFGETYANHIPNTCGVYTFLVQPGIAAHPNCSYLLYVGETSEQNFRMRYKQYLREQKLGDKSRRPHIAEMLQKWEGYLWFCYASVKRLDQIVQIEEILLSSYLPPTNKDFPAHISQTLRKLFAT